MCSAQKVMVVGRRWKQPTYRLGSSSVCPRYEDDHDESASGGGSASGSSPKIIDEPYDEIKLRGARLCTTNQTRRTE